MARALTSNCACPNGELIAMFKIRRPAAPGPPAPAAAP
jgi:hypothetical protein